MLSRFRKWTKDETSLVSSMRDQPAAVIASHLHGSSVGDVQKILQQINADRCFGPVPTDSPTEISKRLADLMRIDAAKHKVVARSQKLGGGNAKDLSLEIHPHGDWESALRRGPTRGELDRVRELEGAAVVRERWPSLFAPSKNTTQSCAKTRLRRSA